MKTLFKSILVCLTVLLMFVSSCSSHKMVSCPTYKNDKSIAATNYKSHRTKKQFTRTHHTKKETRKLTPYIACEQAIYDSHETNLLSYEKPAELKQFTEQLALKNYQITIDNPTHKKSDPEPKTQKRKPTISLKNSLIQTLDISKTIIHKKIVTPSPKNSRKKALGWAVASLSSSIIGFFYAGLYLGMISILFSSIALKRIYKHKYQRGRGIAISGMIIGFLDVILMIFILSSAG